MVLSCKGALRLFEQKVRGEGRMIYSASAKGGKLEIR